MEILNKKAKLKIFINLKNFYELSFEIKAEKDHSSKALMQTVARGIYKELNILFLTYKPIFRKINKLFDNVKSVEDVRAVKLEGK
tara:strand:+ start:688 stop:942 length:255 start_codon:yes stop_codon:yes gene_type:complete